jgi:hypothetical protein
MTDDTLPSTAAGSGKGAPLARALGLISIWFAGVLTLALAGSFDLPPQQPALPTLLAIALPVGLFLVATKVSPRLRALVLGLDPVLLTEVQAWRVVGGAFLLLYAFGQLPGVFAWPAGLGDVAVGLAAPFVAVALRRDASRLAGARFRAFHILGLADSALAVTAGLLARGTIPGLVDQVTTAPMGQLPLVLIPAFVVPLFIILHVIALMQAAAARG